MPSSLPGAPTPGGNPLWYKNTIQDQYHSLYPGGGGNAFAGGDATPTMSSSGGAGSAALPGGGGMGDTLGDIYERLNRLEETVRLLLARG